MPPFALYLLGLPRLECDGKEVHIGRRKALALLSYLAVTKRTHSRDGLAAFLWPEYDRSHALAYLRRVISELNSLLGEEVLEIDRDFCGIHQNTVWLDVSEFRRHVTASESHNHLVSEICDDCIQHLENALELYRGDFLEGLTLPDSAPFDEWQFFQTESLRQDLAVVLERLVYGYNLSKDYITALPYARRWVALNPLHEPAHRSLMKLYADAGQKAVALHQYQLCVKTLARELNLAPSEETTALYEHIRSHPDAKSDTRFLPSDIEPPSAIEHKIPNNLPAQLTSFIGREKEIREIQEMLLRPEVRLLTLTGPGGTGKTRLSLAVAEKVLNEFPDGVFFVPLASLRDPALVLDAIAQAFGLRNAGDMTLAEIIKINLRDKNLLIVLDNFEHVIQAGSEITALLLALPQLKVLVTSRALLNVTGEVNYPVQPMNLPDTETVQNLQLLTQIEAVRLFTDRATSIKPSFTLTEDNIEVVVDICKRLDGLPLAIELAAAKIRTLAPHELLIQLEHRLRILKGGARDLPARQRTLRSTIEWSYDLLGEEERVLFRWLAVFAGGCTLNAVETVYKTVSNPCLQTERNPDVLTNLEKLINQSLIQQSEGQGMARFTMLETIREYALEQMIQHKEADCLQQAHATYFLDLAEEADPQLDGPEPALWLNRLERELDNFRTVLVWALENDVAVGLRLASALENFWIFQARLTEGRTWLTQVLAKGDPADYSLKPLRARALTAACALAWWQGDSGTGVDMGEQSVAIFRALGDQHGLADALRALGQATLSFPDSTMTIPCLEESIFLCRDMHDTLGLMKALLFLGWKLCNVEDFERARSFLEEGYHLAQELGALNMQAWITAPLVFASRHPVDCTTLLPNCEKDLILFRQVGNKLGELLALPSIGHILGGQGHYDQAQKHFQKILSLWLKYGNKANAASALYYLGVYTWLQGFLPEAKSRFLECLEMLREVNIHDFFIASCLFMLTKIIKVEDYPERVATMLGAADVLRSKTKPISEEDDNEYNRIWNAVHQCLDEDAFTTAYDRGLAMTREEAIALGLEAGAMLE